MDFFNSNREKKYGKRAGLFGHKSASKSNPSSPPHLTEGRSPPATYFGIKRSESVHAFPISDEHTTHWKQRIASERVPNSHHRPPVYRYSTPERPSRDHVKDRTNVISYDPDADVTPRSNSSLSPFRSARTRTPDRRRRSTDVSRELYERMYYEAEANVSPFHPSRSRSPTPYNTHDRGRYDSRERYEAEGHHLTSQRKSAPSSPFHPSQSPPHKRPERYNNNGKDHFEGMYEADEDVTPRNSPPMSPVNGYTSRSPPPPFYSSSEEEEEDNNSTYLFPEIATGRRSRGVSGSSTPVHYKYQLTVVDTYEQDRQFEPPELPDESESFTLHEITKMRGLDEIYEAGKEVILSPEAYVMVANYKVRQSVSGTLQEIMEKHGDIAASSRLQSTSTRSFYLESLAGAVMELKSTALRDMKKTRVEEIAAVVKDMESVKIEVTWLKTAVKELGEAVEYIGKYEEAEKEKEECGRDIKEGNVEMEEMKEELRKREKETKECREKVTEMAGRLGKLEMKDKRVKKNIEMFKSKVHKFQGEAVLVDI